MICLSQPFRRDPFLSFILDIGSLTVLSSEKFQSTTRSISDKSFLVMHGTVTGSEG